VQLQNALILHRPNHRVQALSATKLIWRPLPKNANPMAKKGYSR